MAHWNHDVEREDGDNREQDEVAAQQARKWLRREVSKSMGRDPLYGMLADLELAASPFFLGMDYDSDLDDVDEMEDF